MAGDPSVNLNSYKSIKYIYFSKFDLNIYYTIKVVIMPNKKGGKNFKKGKKNRFADDKKQLIKKIPMNLKNMLKSSMPKEMVVLN